ncbi:MAG: hypothetical protein LBQ78_08490 [Tannerellaceae bacterium]|jgi:hypothetical protein|nr:hypothetical protein [Tannerellaceae bacterium]
MKKTIFLSLFLFLIALVNTSSVADYMGEPYGAYRPVFMKRADLENSVSYRDGRALTHPGKIYSRAPYIYVNERYKGVHVINNSDPAHPVNEGFIVAPGCIDMAVKGDIMYLDNAVDLVAFDLVSKKVTKRVKNVFPVPVAPDNSYYWMYDEDMVLVGWEKNK